MQRNKQSMPVASAPVEVGDLRELVRAVAAELKRQLERRAAPPMVESKERTAVKGQMAKQD